MIEARFLLTTIESAISKIGNLSCRKIKIYTCYQIFRQESFKTISLFIDINNYYNWHFSQISLEKIFVMVQKTFPKNSGFGIIENILFKHPGKTNPKCQADKT